LTWAKYIQGNAEDRQELQYLIMRMGLMERALNMNRLEERVKELEKLKWCSTCSRLFYPLDLSRYYSPRKIVKVVATFYHDSNVFKRFFLGL